MSKLHLLSDSSEITCFCYPMGEWQVRLEPKLWKEVQKVDDIYLNAQVQSTEDWIKLLLLVDALKADSDRQIHIALPYLPYGRADRRFVDGDCAGLDVFLNTLLSKASIYTLDPHNIQHCVTLGLHCASPLRFIMKAIIDISLRSGVKNIGLIFPDEGAKLRYNLPKVYGNNHNQIVCNQYFGVKKRDPQTGKIEGISISTPSEDVLLIVDDICDGGRTFNELAKILPSKTSKYLYVTHGIFSQGLDPLKDYKKIYTTDSVDRSKWSSLLTYESLQKIVEFNSSEEVWKG